MRRRGYFAVDRVGNDDLDADDLDDEASEDEVLAPLPTHIVEPPPSTGRLEAIQRLDRPVIVAYVIVVVCLFVVINLIVDIIYSLLDPRVRLSEQTA